MAPSCKFKEEKINDSKNTRIACPKTNGMNLFFLKLEYLIKNAIFVANIRIKTIRYSKIKSIIVNHILV